jgi:hypothetical protein
MGPALKELLHEAGDHRPLHEVLVEAAETGDPDVFRMFYPRVYNNVGQWHSPKLVAAGFTEMLWGLRQIGIGEDSPTAYRLAYPGMRPFIKHRAPLFFLAPDLLKAVQQTDFKDEINWSEMPLPYEQGILVLPKDGLVHETDGECAFIFWNRLKKGDWPGPFPYMPTLEIGFDVFSFMGYMPYVNPLWVHGNLTSTKRPTVKFGEFFYRPEFDDYYKMPVKGLFDSDLSTDESEYLENMARVLFGTLMAINARPELVSLGQLEKKVQPKKDRPAREFWTPNIIGANYRLQRHEPAGGTHASPRIHWRRGHFRQQPYGTGRTLRKTIWMEPMLVGAE